jgi:hypothetical protein
MLHSPRTPPENHAPKKYVERSRAYSMILPPPTCPTPPRQTYSTVPHTHAVASLRRKNITTETERENKKMKKQQGEIFFSLKYKVHYNTAIFSPHIIQHNLIH